MDISVCLLRSSDRYVCCPSMLWPGWDWETLDWNIHGHSPGWSFWGEEQNFSEQWPGYSEEKVRGYILDEKWQAGGEQVVTTIITHLSANSRWTSTSSANNLNCSSKNMWRRIKYAMTTFLYVNEEQRHKCALRPLSVASELPCVWLIVSPLSASK
jgi:hypothetical protein